MVYSQTHKFVVLVNKKIETGKAIFVETMTGGTYQEQLEKTETFSGEDFEYYCVAAFGEQDISVQKHGMQ